MDNVEGGLVLDSVNGVAEEQCVDDSRFTEPERVEHREIFGNSDSSSSSETETEAEPAEEYPSEELVEHGESLSPVSPLDSAASEDVSDHSTSSLKTDEEVDQVDFFPDFIVFNNIYARNALVIFSENCVEAKGLDLSTDEDHFDILLKLDDIVSMESIWVERTQTAMVTIRVIYDGSVDQRFSDIKELRFAATDSSWFDKRGDILSLNQRYDAVWNSVIDTGLEEYDDMAFPVSYIPSFNHFEDFIYPEGDSDAVSMSKRDVDLLEPDTFVNDTIIDFYIKYLKDRIQPEKRHRFHFFNSFFFRKLGDLEKYPTSSFDGRAAFLRVRKWTRKVNLFEKDFVFVPINNHYHWSLIVICHPGEISTFTDVDMGKLAKVPCILHMDSIRGTHSDLECRIRSYLWEEWKERQKETSEDVAAKFSNLRFVSLELPQQENSYDCGLFLLHYVELFLEEDPVGINPFKISKLNKFLNADWFPSAEPSVKRLVIQNLIHNLLEYKSEEIDPANKVIASNTILTASFGQGTEGCNGGLTSLGGSLCTDHRSGVSAGDLFNDSGLPAQASVDVQYHTFDRASSFSEFGNAVVSEQETCGTYDYMESKENGFHISGTIKTEAHEFTSPSRQIHTEEEVSWDQELCLGPTLCNNLDSSSLPCSNDKNALETVQKDGTCCQDNQELGFNDELHKTTKQIIEENETVVAVAESDHSMQALDVNDDKLHSSPEACGKVTPEDPHDCNDVVGRRRSINSDDSDEQHVAKKLRVTTESEECPKSLQEEELCL